MQVYMHCVLVTSSWETPSQSTNCHNPANNSVSGTQADEELDLLFDPQLDCFYDPRTCKYYKLIM